MLGRVSAAYPQLKYIGTQLRNARSADLIDWSAIMYECSTARVFRATSRERVEIIDRCPAPAPGSTALQWR